jgi:hypothetical protein
VPQHIFYSWQADMAPATGKNLIGRALRDAIAMVNADAAVEDADRDDESVAVLDHDTEGVSGSPPIVQIIFEKIDAASAFVSDLTYVAERKDGRRSPNPNVLFEHGWAWKSLTWRAVISVMNIAHGDPRKHPLPFDLQHNKGPIFFDCPDDADLDRRQAERAKLAKALAPRLRAILTDKILLAARIPPAPLEPHPNDLTLIARWRQLMSEPLRLFVREHNFGDVYARGRVAPLHDVAETCLGAQYELDVGELQRPFAAFLEANRVLCGLLVAKTHLLDTNTNLASPKTTLDRRLGTQKSTLEAIDQLNKAASHLADTVDGFDRAVRGRIRVAIAAPEAAGDPARDWANHAIVELSHDRNRGGVPRLVSRPCLTIRIAPYAAHAGQRLDPRAVEQAQLQFPPDEKVRIEESSDARQWWTCAVPMQIPERNPETRWLARLVRPGVIEAEVTIGYRVDDDDAILIDGAMVEREFVGWSERLAGALAATGLTGGGLIQLSLDGTEDVVLRRARPGGKKIGAPSLFLALIDVPDLSAPLARSMHEAFDILWQSAGWRDGSPSFPDGNWSGPQPSRAAL